MTKIIFATAAGLSLLLSAAAAGAAVIVLDADARGRYNETGSSNGADSANNYIAGDCRGPVCKGTSADLRNWFRFDQSSVSGSVIAATLLLDVPDALTGPGLGYASTSDASETYTLFDVSAASAAGLGTDSLAIWTDLGTGTSFGSHVATSADNGTTVSIVLNADALAAINASLGSDFVLGGAITTLNAVADDEYLFGYTFSPPPYHTRLLLTTTQSVPEPAALALFGIALAGLGFSRPARRAFPA
jgi:hypothetical protein